MSRVRGIFPLFLATALGIGNGLWVFGPAFKEQQLEKEDNERKSQELANLSLAGDIKSLRDAEAAASNNAATSATLKLEHQTSSWWSTLSPWSNGPSPNRPDSSSSPAASGEVEDKSSRT